MGRTATTSESARVRRPDHDASIWSGFSLAFGRKPPKAEKEDYGVLSCVTLSMFAGACVAAAMNPTHITKCAFIGTLGIASKATDRRGLLQDMGMAAVEGLVIGAAAGVPPFMAAGASLVGSAVGWAANYLFPPTPKPKKV